MGFYYSLILEQSIVELKLVAVLLEMPKKVIKGELVIKLLLK